MTAIRKLTFVLSVLCTLASCSRYKDVSKGHNYDEKEKLAKELYDKKKYSRALPLYEELITVSKGTTKVENYYYYYAYCNYGVGDYLLANYWFEYYVNTYPFSSRSEECEYMAAYCYYKDSPREPLEQTNTIKAIRELQVFIDAHPQSPKVADCNRLIDELRKKLENKDYRIAVQYLNMEYYVASIVSFQNLLKDYPETERRPEVSYMMVKAAYKYASQSVKGKKKERLLVARGHYEKYCSRLPEANKYAKESKDLMVRIQTDLKVIEAEEAAMLKIETQLFEVASAHYHAKSYKEALDTFHKLLREFPKTQRIQEISYYMIKGSYTLAEEMPVSKKKAKLIDAKNNYTKFARNLKGTQYEKEALTILNSINSQLAELEKKK